MGYNRHQKWHEIMSLLGDIQNLHGATITDKRNGKRWDVGQAVCAEAYGENWQENERFVEMDRHPDSVPPAEEFYNAAVRMSKEKMDWMVK